MDMDWGSEEGRQWCINAGDKEVGLSFAADTQPPHVFVNPALGAMVLRLELFLAGLVHAGPYLELAAKCADAAVHFQWRIRLSDLAKACTAWPNDIAPRIYASAEKAFTIELNKRKHAAAAMGAAQKEAVDAMRTQINATESGVEAAAAGLSLANITLDLALTKLRLATQLITALRAEMLGIMAPSPQTLDMLAQWDKLKGK